MLTLCVGLTACGPTVNEGKTNVIPVLVSPEMAQTPKWMKRKCIRLRPLKKQTLNQAETIKLWAKDVALYNACASRHNSHVAWQAKRDKALAGK